MEKKHEVIIVGGGHNGLLVAAYLAKAGVDVCVVERNETVGGGVVTREVAAPGFKTDICSVIHVMIQANPLILNDELELSSKYGLKYLYPDLQAVVHYHDSSYMKLYLDVDKTCEAIAEFSQKDAKAYKKFHDWALQKLDLLLAGMYSPPPPFGTFVAMLDQSHDGRELLRAMMVSALDIINDWFENEKVKIALTRWVSECMIAPQTKGTGILLFIMVPLLHKYGGGLPVGGSGALSQAIERCIIDHGGTIMTNCPVKKFKTQNGECKGVMLESGEEIAAEKLVVANLNFKQVFPDMVEEGDLPDDFVTGVKRIALSDFMLLKQELALNEAPKYNVGPELDDAFFVEFAPDTLVDYLRYYDEMRYGSRPEMNPFVACQTLHDPTRAPAGKHTLYFGTFTACDLKDGGPEKWDEIREEESDRMLNFLRKYISNLTDDNIIGRWIMTPLDLSRYNLAMIQGDYGSIGAYLHQTLGNRPLPGWNYRTPIKNLYMSGPSTHPGLGVIGGGRAAVQAIMDDLGIDFEEVIK